MYPCVGRSVTLTNIILHIYNILSLANFRPMHIMDNGQIGHTLLNQLLRALSVYSFNIWQVCYILKMCMKLFNAEKMLLLFFFLDKFTAFTHTQFSTNV